jgi:anti-sigma factor RsiW
LTYDSNNQCPTGLEEVAEAYVTGTSPGESAASFEAHFIACDRCASVVQKTAEYVAAMRAAAKKLRDEQSEK